MGPRRYLQYLLFPARGAALVEIVFFSVLLALCPRGGLLALPLALILTAWHFKYAFVMFDATARGLDEPPAMSIDMVNPAELRPLALLAVALVFYGATASLAHLSPQLAIAIQVPGLILAPAFVAILGSTGSIAESINPWTLVQFIGRLGWDYAGLALVIVAYGLLLQYTPWNFGWLVVSCAVLLFVVLSVFSVLGGILYERRYELGFEAWQSPERQEERQERERARDFDRETDEIHVHYRSGYDDAAESTLQSLLEKHGHSIEAYLEFYRRVARWENPRLANTLARELLPALVETRHPGDALRILRERLKASPEFRPQTAEDTLRLARLARSGGDAPTARMLLVDFRHYFPRDTAAIQHASQLAQELER